MVTIINSEADFRLNFNHYVPPVDGALLCAFVGNADPNIALRNFGSLADLTLGGTMPAQGPNDALRTVTHTSLLNTPVARTAGDMTLMAMMSVPAAQTTWCLPVSNERPNVDGGRRGLTLGQTSDGLGRVRFAANGTTDLGGHLNSLSQITGTPTAKILTGVTTLVAGATRVQVFDETSNTSGSLVSSASATLQAAPDEADFPLRVGTNYLSTPTSTTGLVGFVGAWPFALSTAQRAAMVASLRRYFAAHGVTV